MLVFGPLFVFLRSLRANLLSLLLTMIKSFIFAERTFIRKRWHSKIVSNRTLLKYLTTLQNHHRLSPFGSRIFYNKNSPFGELSLKCLGAESDCRRQDFQSCALPLSYPGPSICAGPYHLSYLGS